MPKTTRLILSTLVLSTVVAFAQRATDGEIAGRITDKAGAALPGARVTISSDETSKEAITDIDGRFVVRSFTPTTHHVIAALPGFVSASGVIRLSPTNSRAYVAWHLELGCLDENIRVILSARQAAPVVDAIVHIRVTSANGPVLMSVRPECVGSVLQQYSAQVLDGAPGGRPTTAPAGNLEVFLLPSEGRLEAGREYLALLWADGRAADHLVLPIVSGRVASPAAGELVGMPVREALSTLIGWSRKTGR